MIATDTNTLLRYLLGDDEAQGAAAVRRFHRAFDEGRDVFVSDLVFMEACWVLESAYAMSREGVSAVLGEVIDRRSFAVESRRRIRMALQGYLSSKADFSDLLILHRALDEDAEPVLTFDKALLRHKGAASP